MTRANNRVHRKSLTRLFALAVAPAFVDHVDPIRNDHFAVRARSAIAYASALADDMLSAFERWDEEAKLKRAPKRRGRRRLARGGK